jgi:molybdopterin molybdotransferase
MPELLNVDVALEQILAQIKQLPSEVVFLSAALNRVLADDVRAEINLPPFANSSMDGYAVRAADVVNATTENPASLKVVLDIPAGTFPDRPIGQGEAARILTGAPIPKGADCVIPVEQTDAKWYNQIGTPLDPTVNIYKAGRAGDNIRPIGEDIRAGQVVLSEGRLLGAADIGVLAGLGCSQVKVIRQPRVAILGTGDELVSVDQPLSPGKIRDTNSYTLEALVTTVGALPLRLPIARDSLEEVRALFHSALEQKPDLILSSAGVSVGTADLVRTVLDELGQVGLWRVNLRPGKPLAFGHLQGIPFFGLPGNPVSAMVTFDLFVRPALLKMAGKPDVRKTVYAAIVENLTSDGRRSYLRVTLERDNGHLIARTTGTQSSGALMSMVLADGLLIIPEDVMEITAGTELPVRLLRDI